MGGTIAAVSTGSSGVTLLTLTSVVSGTRSISLPADAEIYENNMLSSADALKVGSYARVNLDRKGTAESVRLGGAVTSYTGSVTGVEQDSLTVTVNGASKRLDIDRFTEVQVGKTAGDYTLLDPQAGYTTATCYVYGRHGPSGRGAALRRHPRRGGHTGEGGKRHRRPAAPGVGL